MTSYHWGKVTGPIGGELRSRVCVLIESLVLHLVIYTDTHYSARSMQTQFKRKWY